MPIKTLVKKNSYHDSVTLMRVSSRLNELDGVQEAAAMMATELNRILMDDVGLLTPEAESAGPNDLVIVIKGDTDDSVDQALDQAEELLRPGGDQATEGRVPLPHTLPEALERQPEANLVLISTPGPYAATEAYRALNEGLHVFMFSDNVSVDEEVMLKRMAQERGLLMMGPDCGTAIINGHPLGFANMVVQGPIGIIGASGTGTQEVTSLIHRLGSGVSQAIGLGSHDLAEAVGGQMMLLALEALAADEDTAVIVLISKPPAPVIVRKILEQVQQIDKPVVVNFLGGDLREINAYGAIPAFTLEDAAAQAVALAEGQEAEPVFFSRPTGEINDIVGRETAGLEPEQRWVRGLFSGGTFATEAQILLRDMVGKIYSNVPLHPDLKLGAHDPSRENTLLDLGADEYTTGRPHPMIDFRFRVDAIRRESEDPETAVILLDVVLGFGAHEDPAGELTPVIREVTERLRREQRAISFVTSVCGTDLDIQDRDEQVRQLTEAGVIVMESNAQAARLAGLIATREAA